MNVYQNWLVSSLSFLRCTSRSPSLPICLLGNLTSAMLTIFHGKYCLILTLLSTIGSDAWGHYCLTNSFIGDSDWHLSHLYFYYIYSEFL